MLGDQETLKGWMQSGAHLQVYTQRTGPSHTQLTGPQEQEDACVLGRYKRRLSSFHVRSATIFTGDTEKHMLLTLLLAGLYIAFT